MPDAFFATSKPRKRKRAKNDAPGGSSNKKTRKMQESSARVNGIGKKKSKAADEELDSDQTNDEDGIGIDAMDLRVSGGEEGSGDEVEEETPAEKRLRLAKMYLESIKGDLGAYGFFFGKWRRLTFCTAEGEFDAAEIDKELISSRLKQDVLEHSGKIHLFVADTVCLLLLIFDGSNLMLLSV